MATAMMFTVGFKKASGEQRRIAVPATTEQEARASVEQTWPGSRITSIKPWPVRS